MKKLAISLIALVALSACSTGHSGSGATIDGTPIIADRVMHTGHDEDVSFQIVGGPSCKGSVNLYNMYQSQKTSTSFPISCSDGTTGTATVAYAQKLRDQLRPGDVHYAYKLTNGKMGSFRI